MKLLTILKRETEYEASKLLMDRDDKIHWKYEVPQMTNGYPTMKVKPSAGAFGLLQSILP